MTADQFAGVAADEIEDPRPVGELLRQWSSLHPEFSFLPRKFKIAVSGAVRDRAVLKAHDVGIQIVRATGMARPAFGAGRRRPGRTPMIGKPCATSCRRAAAAPISRAIMRVYNAEGRRDNKFKGAHQDPRHEIGPETFREKVEAEFKAIGPAAPLKTRSPNSRASRLLRTLDKRLPANREVRGARRSGSWPCGMGEQQFVRASRGRLCGCHRLLKPVGGSPGDMTSDQMRAFADLTDRFRTANCASPMNRTSCCRT